MEQEKGSYTPVMLTGSMPTYTVVFEIEDWLYTSFLSNGLAEKKDNSNLNKDKAKVRKFTGVLHINQI